MLLNGDTEFRHWRIERNLGTPLFSTETTCCFAGPLAPQPLACHKGSCEQKSGRHGSLVPDSSSREPGFKMAGALSLGSQDRGGDVILAD